MYGVFLRLSYFQYFVHSDLKQSGFLVALEYLEDGSVWKALFLTLENLISENMDICLSENV